MQGVLRVQKQRCGAWRCSNTGGDQPGIVSVSQCNSAAPVVAQEQQVTQGISKHTVQQDSETLRSMHPSSAF